MISLVIPPGDQARGCCCCCCFLVCVWPTTLCRRTLLLPASRVLAIDFVKNYSACCISALCYIYRHDFLFWLSCGLLASCS